MTDGTKPAFDPGALFVGHDRDELGSTFYYVGPENQISARLYYHGADEGERALAEAELYAAAPDLYAALNGMLGLVQLFLARPEITQDARDVIERSHRMTAARAALVRAISPNT